MIAAARAMGLTLICCLIAYDAYVLFLNETNHTGLPVIGLAITTLLAGVIAGLLGVVVRKKEWLYVGLIAVVLSANVYGLDRLGIMMNYEEWAERGMPVRSNGCWFIDC